MSSRDRASAPPVGKLDPVCGSTAGAVDRLGSTVVPGVLEVFAGLDVVAPPLLEEGITTGLVEETGALLVVVTGTLLLDGMTPGLVVDGRGGRLDVVAGRLLLDARTLGLVDDGRALVVDVTGALLELTLRVSWLLTPAGSEPAVSVAAALTANHGSGASPTRTAPAQRAARV